MEQPPDRVIARLAARQRTLVSTRQLIACGLGRDAISYRVRAGRYTPIFRGVISLVNGDLPPLAREHAALLACGEGAFLSHHTAAFIWGLRNHPPHPIEVTIVARYAKSRSGIRVHQIPSVEDREVRRHEFLWVSSPARALLEIAATLPAGELADAVGDALAGRLVDRRELQTVLTRHRSGRGAARLAAVMGEDSATTITRSRAERVFLKLIRDARLPRPDVNVRLGRYIPDFIWRRERLIVELDSYQFHAGPDSFHNDREKDLYFRDAGFDVLRFTRNHVVHEPTIALVRLAQALARRT